MDEIMDLANYNDGRRKAAKRNIVLKLNKKTIKKK